MESFRQIQIQILALLFSLLSIASKLYKWALEKSVEHPSRRIPPECLNNPLLGQHLYLKINGTKFHYVESGSRKEKMVLCLHDFCDFWYGWRNQLTGLKHSNRMIALDLKGFGDSEKPFGSSKYKDEVVIEELKRFIDVLQGSDEKIVLIGHGLGGHIAWKFVETHPSMVSKFISISTPHPRIWLKHVMRSWRSVIENRWLYVCRLPFLPEMEMVSNDLDVFDKRLMNGSTSDATPNLICDEVKEAYKYTFSRTTDWQGPINYFRNLPLVDQTILKEEGPKKCIPVDTLFLIGNMDPEINLELVSQSAEYVDRFKFKIVRNVGHSPHLEDPELTNSYMIQFIKDSDMITENEYMGDCNFEQSICLETRNRGFSKKTSSILRSNTFEENDFDIISPACNSHTPKEGFIDIMKMKNNLQNVNTQNMTMATYKGSDSFEACDQQTNDALNNSFHESASMALESNIHKKINSSELSMDEEIISIKEMFEGNVTSIKNERETYKKEVKPDRKKNESNEKKVTQKYSDKEFMYLHSQKEPYAKVEKHTGGKQECIDPHVQTTQVKELKPNQNKQNVSSKVTSNTKEHKPCKKESTSKNKLDELCNKGISNNPKQEVSDEEVMSIQTKQEAPQKKTKLGHLQKEQKQPGKDKRVTVAKHKSSTNEVESDQNKEDSFEREVKYNYIKGAKESIEDKQDTIDFSQSESGFKITRSNIEEKKPSLLDALEKDIQTDEPKNRKPQFHIKEKNNCNIQIPKFRSDLGEIILCRESTPPDVVPGYDVETEGLVKEKGMEKKQNLSKWLVPKSEQEMDENTMKRESPRYSKWLVSKSDVHTDDLWNKNENPDNFKLKLFNHENEKKHHFDDNDSSVTKPSLEKMSVDKACSKMISSSIKFYPHHTILPAQPVDLEFPKPFINVKEIDLDELKLGNFSEAHDDTTTPDVVPEHETGQEISKAKRNLIPSNIDSSEMNIVRSMAGYQTENIGDIIASGTSIVQSYTKPVQKAIESSSSMINSYKEPVRKAIESGSNTFNTYKEAGSNMMKQPVDKVLESGSNLVSSKVTSFTNNLLKLPSIGKFMPWLHDCEEDDTEG